MFDEVVRNQGTKRAARRAAWLCGSAAFHVALVLVLASAAIAARRARETVVEVKFVKGAPVPGKPLAPPVAPARPAPPPPRRAAPPVQPRPEPRPAAPVIQPRDVPAELPGPGPAEPPEPADPGSDEGVVGGAPGGGVTGSPAGSATLAFDEHTMTRPEYLSGPLPEYTRRALQREVEGLMVVRCVVTAEGEVRDCRVLQGLPYMDEAVVEALQRRRYRPATRNGVPVEVSYLFRLHLKLPR